MDYNNFMNILIKYGQIIPKQDEIPIKDDPAITGGMRSEKDNSFPAYAFSTSHSRSGASGSQISS